MRIGQARNPFGASWGNDWTILYGAGADGIWKIPASGGTAKQVIKMSDGEFAHGPQQLPGGEWILFTLTTRARLWDAADIVVQSLISGERKVLVSGGRDGRFIATGHLVYGVDGVLYAHTI